MSIADSTVTRDRDGRREAAPPPPGGGGGECPARRAGHLAALEREYLGPHSRIGEVQHPQAPILHLGHRLDADEPVTELLGERRQRLELRSRVREVVAVRVDDRCAKGPVRAPRHDDEVGLEGRPLVPSSFW